MPCLYCSASLPPSHQTGPAVVSYTSAEELVFRGAVLEGLNGESLDKRLEEDPSFCDIDFLLAALQTVCEGGKVFERCFSELLPAAQTVVV